MDWRHRGVVVPLLAYLNDNKANYELSDVYTAQVWALTVGTPEEKHQARVKLARLWMRVHDRTYRYALAPADRYGWEQAEKIRLELERQCTHGKSDYPRGYSEPHLSEFSCKKNIKKTIGKFFIRGELLSLIHI